MKYFTFLCLSLFFTSCAWLMAHPQVEADLEKEGVDIAKDTEKVIEDIVAPSTLPGTNSAVGQ